MLFVQGFLQKEFQDQIATMSDHDRELLEGFILREIRISGNIQHALEFIKNELQSRVQDTMDRLQQGRS